MKFLRSTECVEVKIHTLHTNAHTYQTANTNNKRSQYATILNHFIEQRLLFIMKERTKKKEKKKAKEIDGIQIEEIKFHALKSFNQLNTRRNGIENETEKTKYRK